MKIIDCVMTKRVGIEERIKIIIQELERLYPDPPIPLDHINNFTLLVAVVLSAQSTDKKVNEVTKALFKKASDPLAMYNLDEKNIHYFIKQLGISKQKAKYIHQLSEKIHKQYKNEVPSNFKDLESLPGVGHKTASVVMAQAFGTPTFPVDTHIHRLAQRWVLTSGINVVQTEADLKRLFPKTKWNKIHIQMILYGREYCTARGCDGRQCLLCKRLFPNRSKPVIYKKA